MNHLFSYIMLTFLVIVNACSGTTGESAYEANTSENSFVVPNPTEINSDQEVATERKLIKKGSIEFETNDIAQTRATVLTAVSKYKGYVSSDDEYKTTYQLTNNIVIRVPSDKFDFFLAEATKGVTKFDNKQINVGDVTEEFLDVQARLKTKKELEQRYLNLLKQAKTVDDILKIEKQIGDLRADIESFEGRLKYLKDQVSLSTITISFYKTIPKQIQFGEKFAKGFKNGWNNLVWFLVFLVNIWPFILVICFIIFWVWRRYKKNQK